jgi:molybdate-binding protein
MVGITASVASAVAVAAGDAGSGVGVEQADTKVRIDKTTITVQCFT